MVAIGHVAMVAKAREDKQTLSMGRGEDTGKTHLSVKTANIRQRISSALVTCFGLRLASRISQVIVTVFLTFLAALSSSRSLVVGPLTFVLMFVKKWLLEYQKVIKTYLPTYL